MTHRTILACGMILCLSGAPLLGGATQSLLIESSVHHLGDENLDGWGLYSLAPLPEGTDWYSAPFDAPNVTGQDVWVVVDTANTEGATVSLNGAPPVALQWDTGADAWLTQSVRFDASLLTPSGNVIGFHSVYSPAYNNWDDFLFQDVRIEVPEPASLSLLALGGCALLRRRR